MDCTDKNTGGRRCFSQDSLNLVLEATREIAIELEHESGGRWHTLFPEIAQIYLSPGFDDMHACEAVPVLGGRYGIVILTPLELTRASQCRLSSETSSDAFNAGIGRVAACVPLGEHAWLSWVSWPHPQPLPDEHGTQIQVDREPVATTADDSHTMLLICRSTLQRSAWKKLATSLGYNVSTTSFNVATLVEQAEEYDHVLFLANTLQEADDMVGCLWFDTSGKSYTKSILCAATGEQEAIDREHATGVRHLTRPFDVVECERFLERLSSPGREGLGGATPQNTGALYENTIAYECEAKTLLQGVSFMLKYGELQRAMDLLHKMASRSTSMGLDTIASLCLDAEMSISGDRIEDRKLVEQLNEQLSRIQPAHSGTSQSSAA